MLLVLIAIYSWTLYHMDIKIDFLAAKLQLHEEIKVVYVSKRLSGPPVHLVCLISFMFI